MQCIIHIFIDEADMQTDVQIDQNLVSDRNEINAMLSVTIPSTHNIWIELQYTKIWIKKCYNQRRL